MLRRSAKTALVLTATCAALALQAGVASGETVVSFTRTSTTPSTTASVVDAASAGQSGTAAIAARAVAASRVWFVLGGGNSGIARLPLDENGNGEYDEGDIPDLPESLPGDSYGRLALLQQAGVALDATTLEQAMSDLELPFMFAGRQQWVLNLTTADGAASDPRLWNVSMDSPVDEPNSARILLGRASWSVSERRSMADDVAYWQSLVPAWAPRVRDALASQGIPFSLELLASPEIEVYDAARPLFTKGMHPVSLQQLGVDQGGEAMFLRSLSAEELMQTVWPFYFRYFHRTAGTPVSDDLAVGLTFGNVVAESCSGPTDCINGIRYKRSPLMSTDSYKRWVAYGTPGNERQNGYILDDGLGWAYQPLTNKFFRVNDGYSDPYSLQRKFWLQLLQTGGIRPEYLPNTPWISVVEDGLMSKVAEAGYLQEPSIWFDGPRAPYAPGNLDQATKDRYAALIAGQ